MTDNFEGALPRFGNPRAMVLDPRRLAGGSGSEIHKVKCHEMRKLWA